MGDKYTYTAPVDDTEVLDSYESIQCSEDQMDDFREKEIVLDSDDESGEKNESANIVNDSYEEVGEQNFDMNMVDTECCVIAKACWRGTRGLATKQKTPTGYFRRPCNKVGSHMFRHLDSARRSGCNNESNDARTYLDNDSKYHSHCVVIDSVLFKSPDQEQGSVNVGKIPSDDSLDKKQSSLPLSKALDVEKDRSYDFGHGELNYIESQETGDLQVEALDFVDRYLLISEFESYEELKTNRICRTKSPPSLKSKGSQCLARRVDSGSYANKTVAFDWAEKEIENDQYSSSRKRKNSHSVFKSEKFGSLCVEESDDINEQMEIPLCDQSKDDLPGTAFDGGINTQMAAEIMESLIYASPPKVDVDKKIKSAHSTLSRQAFAGSRNKGRRSNCIKVSTPELNNDVSCSSAERYEIHMGVEKDLNARNSSGRTLPKVQYIDANPVSKRRKSTNIHDEGHTIGASDKCLNLNSKSCSKVVTNKGKEDTNLKLEMLNDPSKFSIWIHPKGKRSHQNVPRKRSSYQSSSMVPVMEDTEEKCPKLLVYARRPQSSSEKSPKLSVYTRRSSSKLTNDLSSPSVNENEVFNRELPVTSETDKAKPSTHFCELDNGYLPVDTSGDMVLHDLLNDNPTRSPLAKELARLGYSGTQPEILSKYSRRRRDTRKVCVLFSQNLETNILKRQKKIAARLGFSIVSCCPDATHFVTNRFARTRNLMEAMALGKPVVTQLWLESCEQAGCVVDERSYIMRDEKKEKEIGFSMPLSLSQASQRSLLKGLIVFITPNVKPGLDLIARLVKAVQGQVIQDSHTTKMKNGLIPDDLLILSSEEDYAICVPFLQKGGSIYSSELLLHGIITQKLEYKRHQLFKEFK